MALFDDRCSRCGSTEHASEDCPHGFFSDKCGRCGSVNHATDDCPQGFFSEKCSRCGSRDHASNDCPHGFFSDKCSRCGSVNHATEDCPHGFFSDKCSRCGSIDHATDDCPQGFFATRQRQRQTARDDDSDGWEDGLIKLGIGAAIVVAVVWFVFSVVIPLILINTACIAMVAGLTVPKWRTRLLGLSVAGLIYAIFDYNNGWATATLAENVTALQSWIKTFLYLNLGCGLVSAFLLGKDMLDQKYPEEAVPGKPSNRDIALAGGLLALGAVIAGVQYYVDTRDRSDFAPEMETVPDASAVAPAPPVAPSEPAAAEEVPTPMPSPAQPDVAQAAADAADAAEAEKAGNEAAGVAAEDAALPRQPSRAAAPMSAPATRAEAARQSSKAGRQPTAGRPAPARRSRAPTILCVLPNGSERRLTAEECEGNGGMEYQ